LAGKRPPPPFNQGSPRFEERDRNNRSRTVVYDPNKPVVELQQLEGPQQRIKREMMEQNGSSDQANKKEKKLTLGKALSVAPKKIEPNSAIVG